MCQGLDWVARTLHIPDGLWETQCPVLEARVRRDGVTILSQTEDVSGKCRVPRPEEHGRVRA